MIRLQWKDSKQLRGLCFDIENMPGTYGPGDYTHPKVTAVGGVHLDETEPQVWCFTRHDHDDMLRGAETFRAMWDAADWVVGHNIKRHDRKILDGFYFTLGLPLLAPKRMVDTYLDLPKMQGLSRSLENLAARWECPIQKMHMPEHAWEAAYDGVPEFVEMMRARCRTDVEINVWLYHEERKRGYL